MAKITIEWQDGEVFKQEKVTFHYRRDDTLSFAHDGRVYCFRGFKNGTEITTLQDGKMVKAGHIDWGIFFLGNGPSFREQMQQKYRANEALEITFTSRRLS